MAEDVKTTFGGFDAVIDQFLSSGENTTKPIEDDEPIVDPEDIKKQMKSLDKDKNSSKDSSDPKVKPTSKRVDPVEEEDNEDESDEDSTDDEEDDDNNSSDISTEDDEDIEEVELVTAFTDLFAAELGWEFGENDKPKDTKELVKYIKDIIDINSEPKYASESIKELDEFVKAGGKLEDFYKKVYAPELNVDRLNIEKENDQKLIISENLRLKGYSETRIEKLIARYEEAGSLEDEAKDSLEEVKEYKEKTRKELLDQQKKQSEQSLQEQLKFVQNVEEIIKNASDIRGISISDKDKKSLVEYIFKPEADGLTKYQKEYSSNLKNLVESAYFTMKKDSLIQQLEKKASTNAIKDLKSKLKSKGKSTKNTASDQDIDSKISKLWDIASEKLTTFN